MWIGSIALYCSQLEAQLVEDSIQFVPQVAPVDSTKGYFGRTIAVVRDPGRTLLVAAPGRRLAHRFQELDGWQSVATLESGLAHAAVVAGSGHEAVFGDWSMTTSGRLRSFDGWNQPVIAESLSDQPRVLEARPGLIAAGMVSLHFMADVVQVWRLNSQTGIWIADPLIVGTSTWGFGSALALHPTKARLAVGHPGFDANGVVTIYEFVSGEWRVQHTVSPPAEFDGQFDAAFGESIDLLGDWLVVGAPLTDKIIDFVGTPADDVGAILLYRYDALSAEYQFHTRIQDVHDDDRLGTSVALGDRSGTTFVVAGAPGDDLGAPDTGGAKSYRFSESAGWTVAERFAAFDRGEDDAFGTSVAVDGGTIAIGAPRWDWVPSSRGASYFDSGSVYLFDLDGEILLDGFEGGDSSAWGK